MASSRRLVSRCSPWVALAGALPFAGCAPPADFRPPSALTHGSERFEVGGGLVNVSKRPYVDEPSQNIGQVWVTARAARWVSFSAVSAFDDEGSLAGLAATFRPYTSRDFVLGTTAEAGYAWSGASVSGALRLFRDSWVYAAPRISNWGDKLTPGVPVGASFDLVAGFHLRGELQVSWSDLKYYNRRIHAGLAGAYEF